jgi:prefoldin subunit 5
MAGKLDQISHAIGALETSVHELQRRLDENLELQARRHADNSATLRELAAKLDLHAEKVELIRPTVAALELSRSKLATWASLGFAVAILAGWVVEAGVKWAVAWVLSHFQ